MNGYDWFCEIDHLECKSRKCVLRDNNHIFVCLTCVNQYLSKYMLLYGFLNDILSK